ncbi:MAG: tetratricopeptide repeat protein, partial [Elusimicrobiaceae bacterium]|nr:tetratricopeptide repeat protein [Elusimicrobiaceae bacterium]
ASFLLSGCFATQEDTAILKLQISELNRTLQNLQLNQADNAVQMEEIMGRLTQATDHIENFDYKLDELNSKIDNLEVSLKNNKTSVLPTEIYAQAKKQFEEKQYDSALKGFGLYLKATEYKGTSAQEAYLNIARIYYEQKDYQSAAVTAATLMEKFPNGSLIASARLVYAKSILPLGKTEEARNYLDSILEDYPKSKAAKEAATVLKGIK